MSELEANYDFYRSILDREMANHPFKFLVVHGQRVIGRYDTVENAHNAAIEMCGYNSGFIVADLTPDWHLRERSAE